MNRGWIAFVVQGGGGGGPCQPSVSVCTTGTSIIIPLMLSPALRFIPAVCHSRGGGLHMNESLTKHSKAPLAVAELHLLSKQEACLAFRSRPTVRDKGREGELSLRGHVGALWSFVQVWHSHTHTHTLVDSALLRFGLNIKHRGKWDKRSGTVTETEAGDGRRGEDRQREGFYLWNICFRSNIRHETGGRMIHCLWGTLCLARGWRLWHLDTFS